MDHKFYVDNLIKEIKAIDLRISVRPTSKGYSFDGPGSPKKFLKINVGKNRAQVRFYSPKNKGRIYEAGKMVPRPVWRKVETYNLYIGDKISEVMNLIRECFKTSL